MQAVSGISQAIAIRTAPVEAAASASMARKNLDAVEKAGEAVVQLLQEAGDVGRNIDVRV